MIIRIQANGKSFRGAGQYYLHDKAREPLALDGALARLVKPQTDERVWFTDTRNTLSADPWGAINEMWHTAADQKRLKRDAGLPTSGRTCDEPVKTISLSWHKDDAPTPVHMIEAADAYLKHMGWQEHQALYVGHNDTEHRHIHIILNRVHAENGRTLDDYREQKRSSKWALQYEREREQVRCAQRELNAQHEEAMGRAPKHPEAQSAAQQHPDPGTTAQVLVQAPFLKAANDHLPHNVITLTKPHEAAFKSDEAQRQAQLEPPPADLKAELKASQRAEREAFFADGKTLFKATRHAVYDGVRKEYKPEWRDFYKDQKSLREDAAAASETAIGRAMFFARQGLWVEAREAFSNRNAVHDAVEAQLAERKADIKQRQTKELRGRQSDACDALREIRDVQYQDLLQRQRDERAALRASVMLGAATPATTADAIPADVANQNSPAGTAAPDVARAKTPTPDEVATALKPADDAQKKSSQHTPTAPNEASQAADAQSAKPPVLVFEDPPLLLPDLSPPTPIAGAVDLAADAMGGIASYLADQLGEFFAPTAPEQREAMAKAEAKREAMKPEPDPARDLYKGVVADIAAAIEKERAEKGEAWWTERERSKGHGRGR